jgi:AraC-like DNA-binding protein
LILREVGLDPETVRTPKARIPFAKHVALFEAAAEHLGDPHFGLHFGSSVDPLDAGLIGYVAANSATLGDAFRNMTRYLRVFSEGAHVDLQTADVLAVLAFDVIDPDARRRVQIQEFGMAMVMNFGRFVTGRHMTPEWVEFSHNRSGQVDDFERYFGAPVHFGRDRNALVLKQSDIEHLVARLLPSGSVTTRSVAKELGLSERTMARRLADAGTSYRQIIDEVRRDLAKRYMVEPNVRPSQIARLLGYSEPSAFTHAFRRWTGQSPSRFREDAG